MSKINLQRGNLTVENRKSREKQKICYVADVVLTSARRRRVYWYNYRYYIIIYYETRTVQ